MCGCGCDDDNVVRCDDGYEWGRCGCDGATTMTMSGVSSGMSDGRAAGGMGAYAGR